MAQSLTGLKSILSLPWAYRCAQLMFGAERCRRELARTYLHPEPGSRVLDIGCGTAEILEHLPPVEYFGFDLSPAYIKAAEQRYGDRGKFRCQRVSAATLAEGPPYDLVIAFGILHHLDDDEALQLIELAHAALRPGGRLVTLDAAYIDGQSAIDRFLVRNDRGRSVRSPEGYRELAASRFPLVDVHVRHDLLRVPYTHAILVATTQATQGA